jgi:signal transduction histidine kinase
MDPIVSLARVSRRPSRGDLVAAGAIAAWAILEAVLGSGPGSTLARIGFALLISVPLIVRRRAPLAVAAFVSVVSVAWALSADKPEAGTMPFPALLLAIFSAALYGRNMGTAALGGAMPIAAMLISVNSDYYEGNPGAGDLAILSFFCCCAWTGGWLIRRRANQVRRAYAESGELARSAVAEERARIARELHDVVAHSVSIIAVQAGAAEQVIETDPAAAREYMGAVRRTARETMREMRGLLSVLREDEASYAPQPGLSRLQDLLDEVRETGVAVELVESGERRELPAGIDLVAFRVVQESLTNVRKHAAGAPARVALRYAPEAVEVEVTNEAGQAQARNGEGGGHGLVGMRERVRIFGGEFEAGAQNGGFRVRAILPLEGEL